MQTNNVRSIQKAKQQKKPKAKPSLVNNEAEQSVLGSIFLKPELIDDFAKVITKDYFHSRTHQIIFTRMIECYKKNNGMLDLVLVEKCFTEEENENINFSYLSEIVTNTPSAANASAYLDIISELYLKRTAINNAKKFESGDISLPQFITNTKELSRDSVDINNLIYPDRKESAFGERILSTKENFATLCRALNTTPRLNMMSYEAELGGFEASESHKLIEIESHLISHCELTGLPIRAIKDHLLASCSSNQYHPVKEYLTSGEWDEVERVERVLNAIKSTDQDYSNKVLASFLIGCVGSVFERRFQTKLVPVLQGDQDDMKTAALSRIFSVVDGAFSEGMEIDPSNKDTLIKSVTFWVAELGELERTTSRAQGSLKAFISNHEDVYRPPYAASNVKKPRQTSYIGTVNGTEFLCDETGSARFATINLDGKIDIATINEVLGWEWDGSVAKLTKANELAQFWFELVECYTNGHRWTLDEETKAKALATNNKHQQELPFVAEIKAHFDPTGQYSRWYKAGEIAKMINAQSGQAARVGRALKQLAEVKGITTKKISGSASYWLAKRESNIML